MSDGHDQDERLTGQEPNEDVRRSGQETLDPASRALAEALRISFGVLKLVMVCVVAFFVWSGAFKVEQNERALVLRFGRLRGGESVKAIKEPGWHWAWPYPLEEVVKIPGEKAEQELRIDSFWYYETPDEKLGLKKARVGPTLQFVRDGYSLTASSGAGGVGAGIQVAEAAAGQAGTAGGSAAAETGSAATDYNLLHTRWRVLYTVSDPLLFFRRLWSGKKGSNHLYDWTGVEDLLKGALADAVIVTSAQRDIDSIIGKGKQEFAEAVERQMVGRLEALGVGVSAKLDLTACRVPRQVQAAFDRAASAGIRAEEFVKGARAQANETVSQAEADAIVTIAQAEAYRTRVVQAAAADGQYLADLLARIDEAVRQRVPEGTPNDKQQYRQMHEKLLAEAVDQLYQETLRAVISKADEVFVLKATKGATVEWRPMLSRDATLKPLQITPEVKGYEEKPERPAAPPMMPPGG